MKVEERTAAAVAAVVKGGSSEVAAWAAAGLVAVGPMGVKAAAAAPKAADVAMAAMLVAWRGRTHLGSTAVAGAVFEVAAVGCQALEAGLAGRRSSSRGHNCMCHSLHRALAWCCRT